MTEEEIRKEIALLYDLAIISRTHGDDFEAENAHYHLAIRILREECPHTLKQKYPASGPHKATVECYACGKDLTP